MVYAPKEAALHASLSSGRAERAQGTGAPPHGSAPGPQDRHGQGADWQQDRARLARDLHDGVLQSLAAATVQLEMALPLIRSDPATAQRRVRVIAHMLGEQQRDLRVWVEGLRPGAVNGRLSASELAAILRKQCSRAADQYGLQVAVHVTERGTLARGFAEHVWHIAQEGVTNVAKHARASIAHVAVVLGTSRMRIVISDDGCGFGFRGSLDLAELDRRGLGPISLKERVASLDGNLTLTSTASGSRLEITLPTRCS